jgi:steroid delta-isomerase-like uncharacterized protein
MALSNEEIVREWIDKGFSGGDLTVADRLVADNFVNHSSLPGQQGGRDGLKKAVAALRAAFSDLKVRIDDVVAQGERVAVRDSISAKHTGEFNGVKPSGREVTVDRISFYTVKNGKIVENWSQLDMAGLMRQLTSPAR